MRGLIFSFLIFFLNSLQAKPLELVLWYSLAGQVGEELVALVDGFNQSQNEYKLKPIYKGEYTETLTSFAAAFRAKQPPALVQIYEVGTASMLHPKGVIKKIDELMDEQGIALPKDSFLWALQSHYSEGTKLVAMPFNVSIPVIYYNAELLRKLGYEANSFPSTWDEMEILAAKIKKAGYSCAYTSSYPSWIMIVSFSALHGLPTIKTKPLRANYNNAAVIHHLERLRRWQQLDYFEYGGRSSDATVLFTSGRCAMFSESSGSYNSLAKMVNFPLGVARLPFDNKVSQKRYNNVIGGAAIWAVAGQKPESYRGIAKFFSYLAEEKVQERWHLHTGYLPLGMKGVYANLIQKSKHPILPLAEKDLSNQNNEQEQLQLSPQNQIRTINDEALEAIFSGIKKPKDAMDEAVKQANYILLRFQRNTGALL